MTDVAQLRKLLAEAGVTNLRVRDDGKRLQWDHPDGPFRYRLGADDRGQWGWAMTNTVLDPPGQYTSEGVLDVPVDADDAELLHALYRFFQSELSSLKGDQ